MSVYCVCFVSPLAVTDCHLYTSAHNIIHHTSNHRLLQTGFHRVLLRTSVDTQQWAQPVTAAVHGVSSKKCRQKTRCRIKKKKKKRYLFGSHNTCLKLCMKWLIIRLKIQYIRSTKQPHINKHRNVIVITFEFDSSIRRVYPKRPHKVGNVTRYLRKQANCLFSQLYYGFQLSIR